MSLSNSPPDGINHGHFVTCVVGVVSEFIQEGLISSAKGDLISASARESSCGSSQ